MVGFAQFRQLVLPQSVFGGESSGLSLSLPFHHDDQREIRLLGAESLGGKIPPSRPKGSTRDKDTFFYPAFI